MANLALLTEPVGGVRLYPFDLTDGANAFEAAVDYEYAANENTAFAIEDNSSTEYFEQEVSNNRVLRRVKNTVTIDVATNTVAATADGASDQMTFDLHLTAAQRIALLAYRESGGKYLLVALSYKDSTGAHKVTDYMIGKLSGTPSQATENGFFKMGVTVVGKEITTTLDETALAAAQTAAGVLSVGEGDNPANEYTLPAVTTAHWAKLIQGQAVSVLVA